MLELPPTGSARPGVGLLTCSAVAQFLKALKTDENGVAALEFALLLPLLAATLLVTADVALYASRNFAVQSAAAAAANAVAGLPNVPAGPPPPHLRRGGQLMLPAIGLDTASGSSAADPPQTTVPAQLVPGTGLPRVDIATLVALPDGMSASSLLFWGCRSGATLASVRLPVCANGDRAAAYAEITIRAPVKRLVMWPEILLADRVEARSIVRLG